MPLELHQQRVVNERAELDEKINKLNSFIEEGTIFPTLSELEQGLLKDQLDAMQVYSDLLTKRINNF